jgi:hypothetical protein
VSQEDKIKDLFADKLGNLETPVNPQLWSAIASQVGTTTAASTATGLSTVAKIFIGVAAAGVVATAGFLLTNTSESASIQPTTAQSTFVANNEQTTPNEDVNTTTISTEPKSNSSVEVTEVAKENHPVVKTTSLPAMVPSTVPAETAPVEIIAPFTNLPEVNMTGKSVKNVVVNPDAAKENTVIEPKAHNVPHKIDPVPSVQPEIVPSFEITVLPNVYFLNASGYFSIEHTGECSDFLFTLLNDKNQPVYTSTNVDFQWRGTDKFGDTVAPGEYIYIITAKDKSGESINKYSRLTVMNR